MDEVRRVASAQPGFVVMKQVFRQRGTATRIVDAHGGGIMHSRRLAVLRTKQSSAHDALGGVDIFFSQSRSESQGITDVVESERGGVGGEAIGGMEVDAEKIADGVVVLGASEPSRCNPSGICLDQTVLAGKLAFEPAGNR